MSYRQIIRRFSRTGTTKDRKNLRETWEHSVLDQMKVLGYAPILDLEPYYSTEYNAEKDEFNAVFILHGVYVGEKEARKCKGMIYGMDLQQYTESLLPGPSSKDWD